MNVKLIGLALVLICLIIMALVYHNYLVSNKPRKARYYCAVYPYAWNNGTSLNKTEFEQHIAIVKDLGFDGIVEHTVFGFYDEGLLDWMLELVGNYSLDVMFALYYFNRSYSFPFPDNAWFNRTGFMTSDKDLNLYVEWLKNISSIAVKYSHFKGYILFYVFQHEMRDFWMEQINTTNYEKRMQILISALNDSKPLYLTAEPWGAENSTEEVYQYLPKNFTGVDGFALQGYNFIIDDIQFYLVEEQKNYWSKYFNETHIAEFGYRTKQSEYTHGRASSEEAKARMIREFIKRTWSWDSFVCYFGLTDFPPDGLDWGLIYDNGTYKLSAYAFKELLKK